MNIRIRPNDKPKKSRRVTIEEADEELESGALNADFLKLLYKTEIAIVTRTMSTLLDAEEMIIFTRAWHDGASVSEIAKETQRPPIEIYNTIQGAAKKIKEFLKTKSPLC